MAPPRYRSAQALHEATLEWARDYYAHRWAASDLTYAGACDEWADIATPAGNDARYRRALEVNELAATALEELREEWLSYPVVDCEDVAQVLQRLRAQRTWLVTMLQSGRGRRVEPLAMLAHELRGQGYAADDMLCAVIGAGITSADDYLTVARGARGATLAQGLDIVRRRIRRKIQYLDRVQNSPKNRE